MPPKRRHCDRSSDMQMDDAMPPPSATSYVPFDVQRSSDGAGTDGGATAKTTSDASYDDVERGGAGKAPVGGAAGPASNKDTQKNKIREQFAAFGAMSMPYFRESTAGRRVFYVLVLLALLNSGVRVVFSYLMRDFWTALSEKNQEKFYEIMIHFMIALLLLAPISVLYRFQRQRLAIKWRDWMTGRTLQMYHSNRVYYALERGREIDNPDQRIAEDVKAFTGFSLSLFLNIVTSFIDLVCFSVILFSIRPQLFIAIIGYATFGTLATALIGKKLIRLNFEKLLKEANFRYSLVRIRENAESIAFYSGEDLELKEVGHRFRNVIGNMKEINVAQRNLDFFTTFYNYFTWILPVAVVAPEYFKGNVEMGVVTQSSSAFSHVLDDLSLIINEFESLSEFSAGIERLFRFTMQMRSSDIDRDDDSPIMMLPPGSNDRGFLFSRQKINCADSDTIDLRQQPQTSEQGSSILPEKSEALTLHNVSLATPDHQRLLLKEVDLSLRWGDNLLIVGPSGVGKSSLLRAIAGLWTSGAGSINRPNDLDVYFLPQKPYCALGSLRDQLLYPSANDLTPDDYPDGHRLSRAHVLRQNLSDDKLLGILDSVDLSEVVQRAGKGNPFHGLDVVLDWTNILSLGEQQRLAFGRILVNRPKLVIMDESTSALDVVSENKMFALLKDMADQQSGVGVPVTYISVGHRPTLLKYHSVKLTLRGGSDYSVEPIVKSSTEIES